MNGADPPATARHHTWFRLEAAKTDRMIGPPRSFKVALVCEDSEAKGQASAEGFCRASARQRWRVDRATPRRWRPRAPIFPSPPRAFQRAPAPKDARDVYPAPAPAGGPQFLRYCLFNTITFLTLWPWAFVPVCVAVIVLPSAATASLVVSAGLPSILPMTSNVRSSIRLRAFVVFGA